MKKETKKHREVSDKLHKHFINETNADVDVDELIASLPQVKLSECDNSHDFKIGNIMCDGEMLMYLIING